MIMGQQSKKTKIEVMEGVKTRAGKMFFNDYLVEYIGARWQPIKNSLYDAGYTTREVMEYRDGLLEEFNTICKRNNLHGIV